VTSKDKTCKQRRRQRRQQQQQQQQLLLRHTERQHNTLDGHANYYCTTRARKEMSATNS
jgi:hypothetical protein